MVNVVDEWWSFAPGLGGGAFGADTSLAQYQWNIATIGGSRFGVPVLRGSDYTIPYRAGTAWRPKYPNARTVTLVMWTAGIDPASGSPKVAPGAYGTRDQWNANWQALRALFWNRGPQGSVQGKLTRRWNVGYQGNSIAIVAATAMAEVAGSMDPQMTGRSRSDFSVDLLLNDPYFYGQSQQSIAIPYNTATPATAFGEGLIGEGQSSPVNAMSVAFTGPLTNPTLTNSTTGVILAYNASIANAVTVTCDILNFTCTDSVGVNQVGNIAHAGGRAWMSLVTGVNSFLLTSINGADTGSATVKFNDAYV